MKKRNKLQMENRKLYRKTVELPRGPKGQRRRRTVYAKTKAELNVKAADLRLQIEKGVVTEPSKVRVSDFILTWINDHARTKVEASTLESYLSVFNRHINEHFKRIQIGKFSPIHVSNLLAEMESKGISTSRRKHAITVINQASKQAVQWNLLTRNPCDAITKPRESRKEMICLDEEQAIKFLQYAQDDRLYAMYVLAINCGLRQGELYSLKWEDFDLENRQLSIVRSIKDTAKGKATIGAPKTKASRRRITLPSFVVSAINEHRKQSLREGLASSEWVFCDHNGGLLRRQNVNRRSFKKILEAAELPEIRFHDLRHTAATLLLMKNENPKIVSEMLGHTKVSITLDMYSHVLPTMQESAASKMDSIFSGMKRK